MLAVVLHVVYTYVYRCLLLLLVDVIFTMIFESNKFFSHTSNVLMYYYNLYVCVCVCVSVNVICEMEYDM